MQSMVIHDVALHFRDEGPRKGQAVVFSNSLGTDFRIWRALLPYLPEGLRVVRYDKRGHGLSDCPPGPWTIEDHAADLAGLMDRLGVRDAVVVGLSVGGMIAQALAAARPDLTRALVLCDTAARIGTAEVWNERIDSIGKGGIEAQADAIMTRWFTERFREDRGRLAPWRAMLTRTPLAGYLETARAIRDADLRSAAPRLALPVLAVAGRQDGSTPPDVVRATAALIPGARFEVIEDCAHIPCVERPEALGPLIADFLRGIGCA
jgi:3-oxoadipate enol-lactonase